MQGNVSEKYCKILGRDSIAVEDQRKRNGSLYMLISPVRRNGEWHHFDPLGTAQVIANSSASVIRDNLCGGLPHRWWSRVFAVYYIASPLHERVRFRTGEQVDRWL